MKYKPITTANGVNIFRSDDMRHFLLEQGKSRITLSLANAVVLAHELQGAAVTACRYVDECQEAK